MRFEAIETRRAFEDVASQIRSFILTGASTPGDRLPSEKELAEQFKVGRQAVREALRILESSGLVTVKKGNNGGIFVSDFDTENVSTSISNIIKLRNLSLKDLGEARIELEKIVVRYAAARATPEDLKDLESAVQEAEERLQRGEYPHKENMQFHLLLGRMTGNDMLRIFLQSVVRISAELLMKANDAKSERAVRDHRSILKLISEGNQKECVRFMERHLKWMNKRVALLAHDMLQVKGPTRSLRAEGAKKARQTTAKVD